MGSFFIVKKLLKYDMVRQAIDRQTGIFTPDESDHLNVALSQINEKIKAIKTPVIGWHYDVTVSYTHLTLPTKA